MKYINTILYYKTIKLMLLKRKSAIILLLFITVCESHTHLQNWLFYFFILQIPINEQYELITMVKILLNLFF